MQSQDETCRKFLFTLASSAERRKPIDLLKLNLADWFRSSEIAAGGAGNPTGQRTGLANTTKQIIREKIDAFIANLRKQSPSLSQSAYDAAVCTLANELVLSVSRSEPTVLYSFGRAQKVINLYLKYHYACYFSNRMPVAWTSINTWIKEHADVLHAPVDRNTLLHLDTVQDYRTFTRDAGKSYVRSWKWAMNETLYINIQKALRCMTITGGYSNVLHYDDSVIWSPF